MDLSRSKSDLLSTTTPTNNDKKTNDFIDLMNPNPQSEEDSDGGSSSLNNDKKDEILPSYDFHPIPRPGGGGGGGGVSASLSSSDAPAAAATTSPRAWNSLDSKPNSSTLRSYGSVEPEKVCTEKAHKINDSAILSEIDRTMKKCTDSLLHAIDGLSVRLSQLESRTSRLEYAMDDLKVCICNNHGSADGKMRQLENILLEVQSGMQDIKDKQEVMGGRMQLAKLQMSKVEKSSEMSNGPHIDPAPQLSVSAPQPSQVQQFPMPASLPVPSLPPNSPAPPQQNIQPLPPMTAQFPPPQVGPVPLRDSYFPPPSQPQEAASQQYQMPPPAQPQLQAPTPTLPPPQPQHYQPAPTLPYPQPPPPSQQQHPPVTPANAPPQFQPPMSHHPEENPYIPPQSYPTNPRPPTSQTGSGLPHSQPYYGSPSPMYDAPPSSGRSGSGFSSGYAPPSGPSEPYPYSSTPSHYGSGSSIKPQPHSPGVGSSNYPKIPTARILPQAIPTATGINDGPSSGGGGNRVPIDDVIDKVTSMGFPREHVRATVRKLTENGQSVDLNVVLDKLMNDGDVQPPRGWFGR